MALCVENTLCAPEAGFTCLYSKAVYAHKEDKIGVRR
jgi:hypothetical protein